MTLKRERPACLRNESASVGGRGPSLRGRAAATSREVFRALVREFPAFDVAPPLLGRIEFRRVSGQAFHREPRALRAEKGGHLAALGRGQTIPDENDAAAPRGRMTYDRRRWRLRGLIERVPHSRRYQVTAAGFRTALFFLKRDARILRPGLAEITPGAPRTDTRLQAAFAKVDAAIDHLSATAQIAA